MGRPRFRGELGAKVFDGLPRVNVLEKGLEAVHKLYLQNNTFFRAIINTDLENIAKNSAQSLWKILIIMSTLKPSPFNQNVQEALKLIQNSELSANSVDNLSVSPTPSASSFSSASFDGKGKFALPVEYFNTS